MPEEFEKLTLVLVEDDPGHARLVEKNMARQNMNIDLLWLENGQQAVDFFVHEQEMQGVRIKPFMRVMILLDLNMPVLDGFQVLEQLKTNPKTKHIPIFVLTTSSSPEDIDEAYQLGCNGFVTKPVSYDDLVQTLKQLGTLFDYLRLPTNDLNLIGVN